MNDQPNRIPDVLCYVDGRKREDAEIKRRSGSIRLKEWCRRRLEEKVAGLRRLLKSDQLSGSGKVMLAGAFLYCMVSADVISDLIPVVGYLDDVVVVLAVMMHLDRKTCE